MTARAVGVVGLGTMGAPIAATLATSETFESVVGFDPVASPPSGVRPANALTGPGSLAATSDVLVLSLPDAAVVTAVVDEVLGDRGAVKAIVDTSTIGPWSSRELAIRCAEHEIAFWDCPVLGRPSACGQWTLPYGGAESGPGGIGPAEVLAPLGVVRRVGESGAGSTVKVLNNLMLSVINASIAETLRLAEASGLDPATLVEVLTSSGAASVSGLFKDAAPRAVAGDFDPVFALALMRKDNGLGVELARRAGVDAAMGTAALQVHDAGMAAGLAAEDSIAVVKVSP